jgi:hypothetical protein
MSEWEDKDCLYILTSDCCIQTSFLNSLGNNNYNLVDLFLKKRELIYISLFHSFLTTSSEQDPGIFGISFLSAGDKPSLFLVAFQVPVWDSPVVVLILPLMYEYLRLILPE